MKHQKVLQKHLSTGFSSKGRFVKPLTKLGSVELNTKIKITEYNVFFLKLKQWLIIQPLL